MRRRVAHRIITESLFFWVGFFLLDGCLRYLPARKKLEKGRSLVNTKNSLFKKKKKESVIFNFMTKILTDNLVAVEPFHFTISFLICQLVQNLWKRVCNAHDKPFSDQCSYMNVMNA